MKPLLIDLDYTITDTFSVKLIEVDYFTNTHHFHKDYELVIIFESSGKRIVGDHIESFDSGDVIFLGPELSHAWFNDQKYYDGNNGFRARSAVIYLKRKWVENFILKLPETRSVKKCFENARSGVKIKGNAQKAIFDIALRIKEQEGLLQTIEILRIINEMSAAEEFELLASKSYLNAYDEKEESRIQNVYSYVAKNFAHQIRLEDVAAIANLAPNSFCRYFKSRTHKNFSLFVNEIRVNHACKLLRYKDFSIAYISSESGFGSITNFNKFFKQITQKSPLEFRKEVQHVH